MKKLLASALAVFQLSAIPSNIYQSIREQAFCEFSNDMYLKNDYEALYRNFGLFIDRMDSDPDFAERISKSEQAFLADSELRNRYCAAPPSYRDPRRNSSKRHDKVYFQFISEYYDFVKDKYSDLLVSSCEFEQFMEGMKRLDEVSKKLFGQALNQLENDIPDIREKIYGDYDKLTVISKIVRYEKSEKWGTTPHFDKSTLTLIWDSNDDDNDCLLICKDSNNYSMQSLIKPERMYAHQEESTSALLITGLALPAIGMDINPTLHGVAPIKSDYRYAVISFLLAPHVDMSQMKTDYIE
ncbi:MAG: hypothetical protein M1114_02030 [Candidatus Dependentiae bacterium]|nr:hypothetical protein [Candidatus Dependentiae bacterium]